MYPYDANTRHTTPRLEVCIQHNRCVFRPPPPPPPPLPASPSYMQSRMSLGVCTRLTLPKLIINCHATTSENPMHAYALLNVPNCTRANLRSMCTLTILRPFFQWRARGKLERNVKFFRSPRETKRRWLCFAASTRGRTIWIMLMLCVCVLRVCVCLCDAAVMKNWMRFCAKVEEHTKQINNRKRTRSCSNCCCCICCWYGRLSAGRISSRNCAL